MKHIALLSFFITITVIAGNSLAENVPSFSILDVEFREIDNMTSGEARAYQWAEKAQVKPVWSPDGSMIAFTGYGGNGIWLVSAEGGEARLIHENLHEYNYDGINYTQAGFLAAIAFSPDGSELYFHDWSPYEDSHVKLDSGAIVCNNPKIKAVTILTGEVRVLVERAHFAASFTKDGRYCVYVKMSDDGSREWEGLCVRDLVSGNERSLGVSDRVSFTCLSPDDKTITYIASSDDAGADNLYQIPFEGGQSIKISDFTSENECYSPVSSDYTPDGEWLYFLATYRDLMDSSGYFGSESSVNYAGICCMNLVTGSILQITPNTDYAIWAFPKVSPDGKTIIYTTFHENDEGILISDIHFVDFNPVPFANSNAVETAKPVQFTLGENYPNPFNPETTIEYTLYTSGVVRLAVYNTTGQLVREIVNAAYSPGIHSTVWDGCDDYGNAVSSGTYIYRLDFAGMSVTRRMTLLR